MDSSDSDSNSPDHANNNANLWLLLSEDLMFRIFTFIPPHYLIKSVRYVCKPWAAAIASPGFAQACQRFHVRSKPGLYLQNRKSERSSYILEFYEDDVKSQFERADLETSSYFLEFNEDDVKSRFERTDLETPKKMGDVIATCDGILLLLSKTKQLFLANPILKSWLTIPCFPISRQFFSQLFSFFKFRASYHCTIACVPRTDKFKVFHLDVPVVSGISWYVFYVLRVGIDNSWKEIARKEVPLRSDLVSKPVCNGGNLYWISKLEVIVMDVDKEIILRQYPLPARARFFGPTSKYLRMGDFLSCILVGNSKLTYEIYFLDLDSGIWTIYHETGPFDYMAACVHSLDCPTVSFRLWIHDQIIFRVSPERNYSRKDIHFCYNVKTKQLTKIEDIAVGEFEAWPHTNSLVSLPTTPA